MELISKENIKKLLKKYQIHPVKRLGQNFLIDKKVVKTIIQATMIEPEDIILEIGPGIGNLTQELAKKAKKVIAVEKDPKMVQILKETLKEFDNVEVIRTDIRKIQNSKFKIQNYKLVANLPFYLTAPVIRQFLEPESRPPKVMVLVVQKEVGQRICAKPPQMSILAVSVQFYAKPEIIRYVSKKSFWPQPKIDSAIIKIKPVVLKIRDRGFSAKEENRKLFFKIVKAGFSQPRKQLINNLRDLKLNRDEVRNWLIKSRIQPTQRAETLNINDWIKLTKSFLDNC